MIDSSRAWLPRAAADIGTFEATIVNAIDTWSDRWIPHSSCRFSGLKRSSDEVKRKTTTLTERTDGLLLVESFCDGGEIVVSASGRTKLAGEILGVDFSKIDPLPADQCAVDKVADECIANLQYELGEALSAGSSAPEAFGSVPMDCIYTGKLESGKTHWTIHVRIAEDIVFRLLRANIAVTQGATELEARWSAVQAAPIEVGARIGQCQISFAEIKTLQTGDVVVLDNSLQSRIDLTINGKIVAEKVVELNEHNDTLNLTLGL